MVWFIIRALYTAYFALTIWLDIRALSVFAFSSGTFGERFLRFRSGLAVATFWPLMMFSTEGRKHINNLLKGKN